MADQTDTNVIKFDPIEGLRIYHLAKIAYPELFQQLDLAFEKKLAEKGVQFMDFDDPAFVEALEEFTRQFLELQKNNLEIDKELDRFSPRETVEKAIDEARAFPEAETDDKVRRYIALANEKARKRQIEITNEEAIKRVVSEGLTKAAKESKTPEDFPRNVAAVIAAHPEVTRQIDQEALNTVVAERQKELANDLENEGAILRESLGSPRPDIKARLMARRWAEEGARADPIFIDKLTLEAAALLAQAPEGVGKINFFSGVAQGTQNGFAPALDALMAVAGPQNRDAVVGVIMGSSFDRVTKKPDPNLGDFAHSPAYAEVVRAGKDALGHPPPLEEKSFARRLMAGVAMSSVVGKIAGNPDGAIRDALALAKYGVFNGDFGFPGEKSAPSPSTAQGRSIGVAVAVPVVMFWSVSKIYLATAYAHFPTSFHVDFSGISGWILRLGAREVGGKAVSTLGQKAVSQGVKSGITAWVGRTIGGTLGGLIGGPVGAFIFGTLAGFATSLPGKAVSGFKKMVGVGGKGSRLLNDDMPLVIAAGAVGLLVLMIYLPFTFAPFNNLSEKVRTAALETSGERAIGGGTTPNLAVFSYPNVPVPPQSSITRSPIANITAASITQGPNQGNHVGAEANSYDIGVPIGTPVYSSNNGVIVDLADDFSEGQHVANSAGNFIRVEGIDANGQTYFLTYEHLLGIAPNLVRGAQVTTDTLLGYSDDTGNSTGPHLHYQCNGSVCANMLPGVAQ